MKAWVLAVVLAGGVLLSAGSASLQAAPSPQLEGGGLIWSPIPGKTINSPSDFGLAVTSEGGTFVCSMAGPLTGGFKGLKLMLVQGPVAKGSLKVNGRTATFNGKATIILVPGMRQEPVQILNDVPYTVSVGLGGRGKAWLVLKVPQFTKDLGGDTGGIVKIGSINLER